MSDDYKTPFWVLCNNPMGNDLYAWHCNFCDRYGTRVPRNQRPILMWFSWSEYQNMCMCMECYENKHIDRPRDMLTGRFI